MRTAASRLDRFKRVPTADQGRSPFATCGSTNGLGADPILTIEISNLPEIVRVYTTLCR